MSNAIDITGLTAKDLNLLYPALGGYEVICYLIRERTLAPFEIIKTNESGKHTVKPFSYWNYGICRSLILGKPVGDILFKMWDEHDCDEYSFYAPEKILFEESAVAKVLKTYPAIINSDKVLFSIDPESGEIIHHHDEDSNSQPNHERSCDKDQAWLLLRMEQLLSTLQEAHKEIASLKQKLSLSEKENGTSPKASEARKALTKNTAETWANRLAVAVTLTIILIKKWDTKTDREPWAKDGFTNEELKKYSDELGGLSQRGLRSFKKAFRKSCPEVLLKKGGGARRS